MRANPLPFTSEYLNQLFKYIPETGHLIFKPRTEDQFDGCSTPDKLCRYWNKRHSGKRAGYIPSKKTGYRCVTIHDKAYPEHRVIFLLACGYEPDQVDHINGVRDDNRFDNLREANSTINARNSKKSPRNTSGYQGVYWNKRWGRWTAMIGSRKETGKDLKYLGGFETFEEAKSARMKAEIDMGYHANHGRSN